MPAVLLGCLTGSEAGAHTTAFFTLRVRGLRTAWSRKTQATGQEGGSRQHQPKADGLEAPGEATCVRKMEKPETWRQASEGSKGYTCLGSLEPFKMGTLPFSFPCYFIWIITSPHLGGSSLLRVLASKQCSPDMP